MQKFKKHLIGLLLVSTAIIAIMGSKSSKEVADNPHSYPPDFGTYKSHILVITYDPAKDDDHYSRGMGKSFTNKVKSAFPKYYTGDYDFVIMTEDITHDSTGYKVINSAYEDVNKYRYIFFDDYSVEGIHETSFRYGVYDRKTNMTYQTNLYAGERTLLDSYVKKLEEVRAK